MPFPALGDREAAIECLAFGIAVAHGITTEEWIAAEGSERRAQLVDMAADILEPFNITRKGLN